jgi:tetratricopeptide (TPR) repeat protein
VLPARRRTLLTLAFALWSLPLWAADSAPAPKAPRPTAEQIAAWVKQLGDNRFAAREEASRKLWAAGQAAEAALETAAKSDDAEVARRARDILAKFRWGIYPDTPADLVALINAYQSSEGSARDDALHKLLQAGPQGLQAAFKIYKSETDPNRRNEVSARISTYLPLTVPGVLAGGSHEAFEALLELGHDSGAIGPGHYTAWWLLRGKLDERIAHVRALLDKKPSEKRHAETLAYLYRARGDLPEARKAAEKAEALTAEPAQKRRAAALVEGILYEAADWKALAARPDVTAGDSAVEKSAAEKSAYRAAYARLAGDARAFEAALDELRKLAAGPDRQSLFPVAKAFLLNDRPAEGLELLARVPDRRAVHFEILCAQLRFREALELADKTDDGKQQHALQALAARTLYLMGERDKAQALFARLGEQVKEGADPLWYEGLLDAEHRAGLDELAFEHCARVLTASRQKDWPPHLSPRLFLAKVFPDGADAADVWWDFLRKKYPQEATADVLKRVRDVLKGKAAVGDVKRWIDELAQAQGGVPAGEADRRLQALADAAVAAGLEDLARSHLEKAATPAALTRLGDLLAAKKQWPAAARSYRRAWDRSLEQKKNAQGDRERHDPLPLYLAGRALVQAGQPNEGEKLIEQSHWVLLGDIPGRLAFFRALAQRKHRGAADREADIIWRVSEPGPSSSGVVAPRRAAAALARKDYAKAADGYEQTVLRCLRSYIYFVQPGAYVGVPCNVHRLRATALLAAGRADEARREIALAQAAQPGNIELPIALVPELERRGHKQDAARLFEQSVAAWEKLSREYPRCALAHNSVAWVSVCCRRNLDAALTHALRAVELTPDNPSHLDTLAEVYFQRGDKAKAVALQKRVVTLDPKKTYFRKQLARLEAGDPAAPRPAEDNE